MNTRFISLGKGTLRLTCSYSERELRHWVQRAGTTVDNFFDMPEDYLAKMLVFAQPIARAIEKAFDCNRCGLSVVGLEVPHAHLHLVPIDSSDDLNFTRHKLKLSPEQLKAAQESILRHLI